MPKRPPPNPYMDASDKDLAVSLMTAAGLLLEGGMAGWSAEKRAAAEQRMGYLMIAASWRIDPPTCPPDMTREEHKAHLAKWRKP